MVKCCQKSKVCYAHFTFLQHLTPSQTFITSKKINYDSKESYLKNKSGLFFETW